LVKVRRLALDEFAKKTGRLDSMFFLDEELV
jgi:hypothetical protein